MLDADLLPFGWAPGLYTFKCRDPDHVDPTKKGEGAKLSWRCRECAEKCFSEVASTSPAPSVQPVRAWAVVDNERTLQSFDDLFEHNSNAKTIAALRNLRDPEYAPHRVIRVEIREVNDE